MILVSLDMEDQSSPSDAAHLIEGFCQRPIVYKPGICGQLGCRFVYFIVGLFLRRAFAVGALRLKASACEDCREKSSAGRKINGSFKQGEHQIAGKTGIWMAGLE